METQPMDWFSLWASKFSLSLFFFLWNNVFCCGVHRVQPPGPVCGCEPRLSAVGAQGGAAVHLVPLLALPHASQLHPAGQRRLPVGEALHDARSGTVSVSSLLSLLLMMVFQPSRWVISVSLCRFCGPSKPKLSTGSTSPTSSQPEFYPAEEVNSVLFPIRLIISYKTNPNYVLGIIWSQAIFKQTNKKKMIFIIFVQFLHFIFFFGLITLICDTNVNILIPPFLRRSKKVFLFYV